MDHSSDLRLTIENLNLICSKITTAHEASVIDDALLALFLEETSSIQFSREQKLIVFAGHVNTEYGWNESCKVYKFIQKIVDEEVGKGVYAVWLALGLEAMKDVVNRTLDDRLNIAFSLLSTLEQASGSDKESLALTWGHYFYYHPSSPERHKHLESAVNWLNLSVAQKRDADELDSDTLCHLANAYFELGRIQEAARIYAEIDLEQLEPVGAISKETVLSNLSICKQNCEDDDGPRKIDH